MFMPTNVMSMKHKTFTFNEYWSTDSVGHC